MKKQSTCLFASFLSSLIFIGCVSTTQMYDEFQSSARTTYDSPEGAFKSLRPTLKYVLRSRTPIELAKTDPVLMLDKNTDNRGYFKIVEFEIKEQGNYDIKGIINCRCFGKLSGKNAVMARLFLLNRKTGKILMSFPGITKEHISFVDGDQWANRLQASLTPGLYSLIVAADNAVKGASIFNFEAYGAMPVPVTIDIYSSPDGKVDLQIQPKPMNSTSAVPSSGRAD